MKGESTKNQDQRTKNPIPQILQTSNSSNFKLFKRGTRNTERLSNHSITKLTQKHHGKN